MRATALSVATVVAHASGHLQGDCHVCSSIAIAIALAWFPFYHLWRGFSLGLELCVSATSVGAR